MLVAWYFFPFLLLLLFDDSFDVQVPGIEDASVVSYLEIPILLDHYVGSLLQS